MATKKFAFTKPILSLLLMAALLYGQQVVAEGGAASSKSLAELQQALAKNKAELEARKQNNIRLAEQRKNLESEVVRLQALLLKQEQSAEAVSKIKVPSGERKQPIAQ